MKKIRIFLFISFSLLSLTLSAGESLDESVCEKAAETSRQNYFTEKEQVVRGNEYVMLTRAERRKYFEENARAFYALVVPAINLANKAVQNVSAHTLAMIKTDLILTEEEKTRLGATDNVVDGLKSDLKGLLHFYPTSSFPMCVNEENHSYWWLEGNGQKCRWHGWIYFPSRPADIGYNAGIFLGIEKSTHGLYLDLDYIRPEVMAERPYGSSGGRRMDDFASEVLDSSPEIFKKYSRTATAEIHISKRDILDHRIISTSDLNMVKTDALTPEVTLEQYMFTWLPKGCFDSHVAKRLAAINAERKAPPGVESWLYNGIP